MPGLLAGWGGGACGTIDRQSAGCAPHALSAAAAPPSMAFRVFGLSRNFTLLNLSVSTEKNRSFDSYGGNVI